ncbi:replicative DNA helicase [Candidatus Acetothermia bacterium]|nr:replicative DNA helicase [Candidatus Acetothermia bacterium]
MAEAPESTRTLPKNREAEQVILGALMFEAETVVPLLQAKLLPDQFYWPPHRTIYHAILDLTESAKPVDLITVGNRLEELGKLAEVGGRAYLSEIYSKVTTTTSVDHYADIIRKKAVLRDLITAGREIAELGFDEELEITQLLDAAEEKLFRISRLEVQQNYYLIRDFIHEHLSHLEKLQRDPSQHTVTGHATGYQKLDELMSGLQPSDLVVIAARPSVGKTSFALSVTRHMALKYNKCVGIFTLEMTKEQVLERLLCAEARINLHRLRGGYLQTDGKAWSSIINAAGKLQNSKIIIDDTPGISITELKAKARRMKAEHNLDVVFVDYLQLVEASGYSDVREQEVAYMVRSLKGLARELSVPVVTLSQLSRAPERPPREPRLSDLRESGEIEQAADVVIFIHREEPRKDEEESPAEDRPEQQEALAEDLKLIIGKQRNGPTGSITLRFLRSYASFEELAYQPFPARDEAPF